METVGGIMQGNQRQAALNWAYLAGLIDGEGSFFVSKTEVNKIPAQCKCQSPKYLGWFSLGMVHEETVNFVHSMMGAGKVYNEKRVSQNRQPIYRIRFAGRLKLIPFIKNVLPYLITKKEAAETLLDFLENWVTPGRTKGRRSLTDPVEIQRREEAYQKLRKLNAVGAAATTKSFCSREVEAIV